MNEQTTPSPSLVAAEQLKSIVGRIENLEEEKTEVVEHIKEIYAEAKANGFDAKTIRRCVSLRKKTADERAEEEAVLDLYLSALGMLKDTPLGRWAAVKEAAEGLGTPVEPTAEELAAGVIAAFDKDGTRMTITPGSAKAA